MVNAAPLETSSARAVQSPPNLKFSHFGMTTRDIEKMTRFYTDVLGFTITDRGPAAGLNFVFLSRDPMEHHQMVLTDGRPDNIPANTGNAHFGACIQHISFAMNSLADLRDMCTRLERGGATEIRPSNHGVMYSVYAHDPEGNPLEFFLYSDWYIDQPFIIPLDFSKTDEELIAQTKAVCEQHSGFEPLADWRARLAQRVTPFVESTP